jgi:hypothetical protein
MTAMTVLGSVIAELQADPSVAAITRRIRPVEPAKGDAQGPGHYLPFVVLSVLDDPWTPGTATATASIGIRCYGPTFPAAEALYLACAAVFHRRPGRISAGRLGIYSSTVHGGGAPDRDPDTQQPLFHGVVELNHSIQPIP